MGGARAHVRAHQHVATSCGTKNMLPKIRDLKFTGEARDYMQFRADFYHRIFILVQDKATAMLHLDNCLPVWHRGSRMRFHPMRACQMDWALI